MIMTDTFLFFLLRVTRKNWSNGYQISNNGKIRQNYGSWGKHCYTHAFTHTHTHTHTLSKKKKKKKMTPIISDLYVF